MNKPNPWCLLALAFALLLGSYIRIAPLAHRPFWFDEGDTYMAAAPEAGITYDRFFRWTNHFENAPLSALLPRLMMDATGSQSEWVMRLPALTAGILCILAAYWLGSTAAGPAAGALMALLVAVDPNMVDQSQQCRMYTYLMLFTLVAAGWSIRLLRNPDAPKWHWLIPGLMMGLCLWATLLGTMVWAGLALGVVALLAAGSLAGRPHPQARLVLTGFLFTGLVALLTAQTGVFLIFQKLLVGGRGRGADMKIPGIAREIVVALKDLAEPQHPVMLLIYPLAAVGLFLLARKCKSSAAILAGLAVATFIMLFPFRKQHHFMDPRDLTIAQPALWAGLAMLPLAFRNPRPDAPRSPLRPALAAAGALLFAAVLFVNLWQSTHLQHYWQQPERYDLARAILAVKARLAPADAAAIDPPSAEVLTHYYRLPLDPTLNDALYTLIPGHRWVQDPKLPDSYAAPVTWVVVGNVDDDLRLDPANQRYILRPLLAVAQHYGRTIDPAEFKQHIRLHHVTAVRFDKSGVTWFDPKDLAPVRPN